MRFLQRMMCKNICRNREKDLKSVNAKMMTERRDERDANEDAVLEQGATGCGLWRQQLWSPALTTRSDFSSKLNTVQGNTGP
jgi:hypothetical protein